MSGIQGKVGKHELSWASIPRGPAGSARVRVGGEELEVRWRRDADGIWIELPSGVHGFDVQGEPDDEGRLSYVLSSRGGDARFAGLSFRRAGEEAVDAGGEGRKKALRVRAQMPGKIVRVLVQPGAEVAKDQPLLVMEAMKMENEIRAPNAGKVVTLKVTEGQAVESGADLLVLE